MRVRGKHGQSARGSCDEICPDATAPATDEIHTSSDWVKGAGGSVDQINILNYVSTRLKNAPVTIS